jgi:hypothetical protein
MSWYIDNRISLISVHSRLGNRGVVTKLLGVLPEDRNNALEDDGPYRLEQIPDTWLCEAAALRIVYYDLWF